MQNNFHQEHFSMGQLFLVIYVHNYIFLDKHTCNEIYYENTSIIDCNRGIIHFERGQISAFCISPGTWLPVNDELTSSGN